VIQIVLINSVAWQVEHHENEDPVFFGFEIIIDKLDSSLNGSLDEFLQKSERVTEIKSRSDISESFKINYRNF
jgi:hypothetical protein